MSPWGSMTRLERRRAVIEAYNAGQSYADIAAGLGAGIGASGRNKVAGILNRERKASNSGLARRKHGGNHVYPSDRAPPQAIPRAKAVAIRPPLAPRKQTKHDPDAARRIRQGKAFVPLDGIEPVEIADLEIEHCRWPIGEGDAVATAFCGAPNSFPDDNYCALHRSMASHAPTTEA